MITKQYKALLKAFLLSSTGRLIGYECKRQGGNTAYINRAYNGYIFTTNVQINNNLNYAGIIFGTGTTAATENDYALESKITSGLSYVSVVENTSSYEDENGNPQRVVLISIQNTSASNITISEIGTVCSCYYATTPTGTANSSEGFLMDRTVLDSPITLGPNDIATIQYVIKNIINAA